MTRVEPIVLASASPRRRQMFEDLGLPFEVCPAQTDERPLAGETPLEYVLRAAGEKAISVATKLAADGRSPWIVAGDTVVVLGEELLGKPVDDADAREMLRRLSGKTHTVITGWAVGRHQGEWTAQHAETRVSFHALTAAEVDAYVATGEGRDKAGAYAIQGIGAFLVDRLDGDYFNVVGLPISRVVRALVEVGALPAYPLG